MKPDHREADSITHRLESLERENRRLKWAGGAMLVGIAAVVLMGQAVPRAPRTVEAERFVLRDTRGKMRAELTNSAGEVGPALFLYHRNGDPDNPRHAIDLQVLDDPGGLTRVGLRDSQGQMLAQLEVSTKGLVSLTLRDERFNTRAVLGHTKLEITRTGTVEQHPASSLVLFDKDGKVIWKAP